MDVSEHALVTIMLANAVGFGHSELPALAALDGHLNRVDLILQTIPHADKYDQLLIRHFFFALRSGSVSRSRSRRGSTQFTTARTTEHLKSDKATRSGKVVAIAASGDSARARRQAQR
jgi:hypothetical protein